MTIDRLGPSQRPAGRPAGYQKWRRLLFLHWPVPIAALRPLVPAELELDLWDGEAFVGVVPFAMADIRPAVCPAGWGLNFLEANVRTYVVLDGQPGVYFLSLEASSRLAVWAARQGWSLPYYFARMNLEQIGEETDFATKRPSGPGLHVRYRVGAMRGASQPETLEHFFLERYLLFVRRRGKMQIGQVHHVPYPAQDAEVLQVEDQLLAAAGLPGPAGLPRYSHYAAGVDVEVFPLRPFATPPRNCENSFLS